MTKLTIPLAIPFALLLAACPSSSARTSDRTAPVIPELVELSRIEADVSLWPEGSKSVVTIVGQSPDDPTHFRAYIVDVSRGTIAWHIDGTSSSDYAALHARIAASAVSAEQRDPSLDVYNGGGGYTGVPLPRPGGPGGIDPKAVVELARTTADAHARAFGR